MTATIETRVRPAAGLRSPRAALLMWQMDEQREALIAATRGLTVGELGWQPAPGMNTIGMLLAHVAYAEAHLTQVGLLGEAVGHAQDVIGIREEDEGLPLAPGAPASPALAGKDLAFFDAALGRARVRTREVVATLGDEDLAGTIERTRPDGTRRVFDRAWVLHHLVEHEAGHRGQIQLLRHLYRTSHAAG